MKLFYVSGAAARKEVVAGQALPGRRSTNRKRRGAKAIWP